MKKRKLSLITGTFFAATFLFVSPGHAAMQLEPGEWQDTETGNENGQPAQPEVTTSCMTAEDAKDVVKALSQLQNTAGQQCKTMHVQDSGNTLSFDMECGDPKQILIAVTMKMTFLNSRHYTGTVKSNVAFAGKTVTTDKQLDSKWIAAACRK